MYGHLHVLHFILYLTFTASLYDGKYACFHMEVAGAQWLSGRVLD